MHRAVFCHTPGSGALCDAEASESDSPATLALMILLFTGLTALSARLCLHLPWTPVPLTGQTFAVLLSGALLGRWGSVSQSLYLGLGLAGIPWFASLSTSALTGPTLGYLAGFIAAPWAMDRCFRAFPGARSFQGTVIIMMTVNMAVIHGAGTLWLHLWRLALALPSASGLDLFSMGSLYFIPGDIIKALVAAACAAASTNTTSRS
jgi:biotin transport system substrate-specific component